MADRLSARRVRGPAPGRSPEASKPALFVYGISRRQFDHFAEIHHIPARLLRKDCALDEAGERTLELAVRRMGFRRGRMTGFSSWRGRSRIWTGRKW